MSHNGFIPSSHLIKLGLTGSRELQNSFASSMQRIYYHYHLALKVTVFKNYYSVRSCFYSLVVKMTSKSVSRTDHWTQFLLLLLSSPGGLVGLCRNPVSGNWEGQKF